jgi:hypothetical protein
VIVCRSHQQYIFKFQYSSLQHDHWLIKATIGRYALWVMLYFCNRKSTTKTRCRQVVLCSCCFIYRCMECLFFNQFCLLEYTNEWTLNGLFLLMPILSHHEQVVRQRTYHATSSDSFITTVTWYNILYNTCHVLKFHRKMYILLDKYSLHT